MSYLLPPKDKPDLPKMPHKINDVKIQIFKHPQYQTKIDIKERHFFEDCARYDLHPLFGKDPPCMIKWNNEWARSMWKHLYWNVPYENRNISQII